jgi:hypothetical protein
VFKPCRGRLIFLRAIKIRSMTSFGGEVKPSAPCRKILKHVKDPLRYEKIYLLAKFMDISRQVSPRFATRCLLQPEQRTVVDESGVIRVQMGSTVDQKVVSFA